MNDDSLTPRKASHRMQKHLDLLTLTDSLELFLAGVIDFEGFMARWRMPFRRIVEQHAGG